MARTVSIEKVAKEGVVRRLRAKRVTEKDVDARAKEYRARIAALPTRPVSRRAGAARVGAAAAGMQRTILAEGDSWFRYVVGFAVIWHLEKKLRVPILNLATPGDEASEMLSEDQRGRLRRELRRGPALRRRYDFLLFSGGGNDLLANDRLRRWLNDYTPGMTAKQVVNGKALDVVLAMLELNYRELIALRDKHSPTTHLVLHTYDFAVPNGTKVCGLGPWLKPSLVARMVPAALRQEVVKELLLRFRQRLQAVVASSASRSNISIVDTQGALTAKDWENEIHPTKHGFGLIADRFAAHLKAAR